MPGPFHYSAAGCRMLGVSGSPEGLFAVTSDDTVTVDLKPGDSILFFRDGLTDAFDRDEELFGTERLQELCNAERLASPTEMLGRTFAEVKRFMGGQEQYDDMAAALFPYFGRAATDCHRNTKERPI